MTAFRPVTAAGSAAIVVLLVTATSAHAIPRTFVSGTGAGVTCTRAAPCATFQAAHNATNAGGEINCIDAGDFGSVTISRSITIDCTGALGTVSSSVQDAITINTAGVIVRLRNLALDGLGGGSVGINFANGAALFVENCGIANFGNAIIFAPVSGTARLSLTDSVITNSQGSGIFVGSGASPGSPRAVLDGVRTALSGTNGIRVSGALATGPAIVHVRNSIATQNSVDGIRVDSAGSAIISVTADRTSLTLNGANGVSATGPNTFVLLGRSTAMSNVTGVGPSGGGSISSYRNNHLTGNVSDGTPTASLTLK